MALGGMLATFLRAIAIILLGSLLFHVQYAIGNFFQLIGVFFAAMTALYGLGMCTASLFLLLSREADHLVQLGAGTGLSGFGILFPDSVVQLLDCRGRLRSFR